MHEEYYTPEEVAKRLKVHPETVRRWVRSGKLRAVNVGRDWRISEADIEEYLSSKANRPSKGDQQP